MSTHRSKVTPVANEGDPQQDIVLAINEDNPYQHPKITSGDSRIVCSTPIQGRRYYWLRHPRSLCTVLSKAVTPPRHEIALEISYYRGYDGFPTETVYWTKEEWDAVAGKTLIDWWAPVDPKHLAPNEEPCHVCHGDGWEQDRDLEMSLCFWCKTTGKKPKSPLEIIPPPQPTRRSPLHPELPPNSERNKT